MSDLVATIAPAQSVAVPASVGTSFVDIAYTRTIAGSAGDDLSDLPNEVIDTVRVALDPKLTGTFTLADVKPASTFEVRFLAGNGSLKLVKTLQVGDHATASISLSASDVKALAAATPQPPAPAPVADRRAYFVPVGDAPASFDRLKLQLAPISVGGGGWKGLGLDQLFHGSTPASTSVQWIGSGWSPSVVAWSEVPLGADGRFRATFAQKADGVVLDAWLWWLSGPQQAIGVLLDDLSVTRAAPIGIPLPPMAPILGDEPQRTPSPTTEAELAANPAIYTEDPGEFCKPFKNPERVLSERNFFVTLRVEQPLIGSGASIKTKPMPTLTFDMAPRAAEAAGTAAPTMIGRVADAVRTRLGGIVSDAPALTFMRESIPLPYLDMLRRLDRGRTTLDADHPIQWEGDVSRYQATTAARGHILEFRMRWRSNGYSLGTVAKTLTLAPRQTRRIQKIEWQRSESSRRRESTQLRDQVSDSVSRDRSYDDAVRANISEWASGESTSSSYAAAGGAGFAMPGFVIGGGGGGSHAHSSSSESGGRDTSAAEEQRLRDSIRRYGDALRRLESMVVSEVTQQETVTGTTEVVRNQNYAHALTVIYYQILRHLKIETSIAGVRECLFVPFAITPFTIARAYRWRELIGLGLRDPGQASALKYLKDVLTFFASSDVPINRRSDQPVRYVYGSIYLKLAIERPKDKDDGAFDEVAWSVIRGFLGTPALAIYTRLKAIEDAARDAVFQRDHAPTIASSWSDTLELWAGATKLDADFTLATRYAFNGVVRVDFTAPVSQNVSRETLTSLRVTATKDLPPGSVAHLTSLDFTYDTDQFQRSVKVHQGEHDLVSMETGVHDAGAALFAPPDAWERRNIRQEMTAAVQGLVEHLNEHVEYYHKTIWWNMDRDRLFMLIDGFYVPGTNDISIASVVERDPIAVVGNALVFRVAAGAFLGIGDITTPAQLLNHYVSGQAPEEPMLLALPTDGLYAQTVMDECGALEEHFGNTDWALNDPDPTLGEIAPELLASRRAEPQTSQPTAFPQTIINLQNAPEAPAPSGLAGALSAVTNANAFRDMAGLAGTQANAAAAFQTAASLATNFGNQAAALKLAELAKDAHATQTADQKLATVQRAADKGLVSSDVAGEHASKILDSLHAPDASSPGEQREAAITQAVMAAAESGTPFTVQHATADGATTVSATASSKTPGPPSPSPFPSALSNPLTSDQKLIDAFKAAITIVGTNALYASLSPIDELPIVIVALNADKTRPAVGQHQTGMYYSGSLLKIAAMYAAYQLRHAVNTLALTLDATVSDGDKLFAAISKAFDAQILNAAPNQIKAASTTGKRAPQYRQIFDATRIGSNPWQLTFTNGFADELDKMVVNSHNPSAGFCIQQLGYSWINGMMQKAGLLNASANPPQGIWLAGDYLNPASMINAEHAKRVADPTKGDPDSVEEFDMGISGWATVTIPSLNDGAVKQVTTCVDAARMFVLLRDGELVPNTIGSGATTSVDPANLEMLAQLGRGAVGPAGSIVAPHAVGFTVSQSKIGVGDLKPANGGQKIWAEALIAKQTVGAKREFVVVWQNSKRLSDADANLKVQRISDLIQATMNAFP